MQKFLQPPKNVSYTFLIIKRIIQIQSEFFCDHKSFLVDQLFFFAFLIPDSCHFFVTDFFYFSCEELKRKMLIK